MYCDGPKPRKAVGSIVRYGRPRSTHNRGKDVWVCKLHTKPNTKAHDQTMAQWNTECHRNKSGMLREARQLTDVNVSGVSPSRERA